MKKLIFYCVLMCGVFAAFGQEFEWAGVFENQFGVNEREVAFDVDNKGNTVVIGSIWSNMDFVSTSRQPIGNTSNFDIYFAKISPTGIVKWSHTIGSNSLKDYVGDIATDSSGNVFLFGGVGGIVDIDPSPMSRYDVGRSATSITQFIASYDSTGAFRWAYEVDTTGFVGTVLSRLIIDSSGDLIIKGMFQGINDFDAGPDTFLIESAPRTPNGGWTNNHFTMKISNNGDFRWAFKTTNSLDLAESTGVAPDGSVYLLGSFRDTIDLDPGPAQFTISNTMGNGYLAKYDSIGNFLWAKVFWGPPIGPYYHTLKGPVINSKNEVFIYGYAVDSFDVDLGSGVKTLPVPQNRPGGFTINFYLKYDQSGNFISANTGGNNNLSFSLNLTLDQYDNIYLYGNYYGRFDMDFGPKTFMSDSNRYGNYVIKMNPNEDFIWGINYQEEPSKGVFSGFYDVQTSSQNDVFCSGRLVGKADIDFGQDTFFLTSFINSSFVYSPNLVLHKISQDSCSTLSISADSISNPSCTSPSYIGYSARFGQPPYSYAWNTSPPLLDSVLQTQTSGYYTITATDSRGCSRSNSHFVKGPDSTAGFDLMTHLVAPANMRFPGSLDVQLDFSNEGCQPVSGFAFITTDTSKATFFLSSIPPDRTTGDSLIWNFSQITFDSLHIKPRVSLLPKATLVLGDSISFEAGILPMLNDNDSSNNIKLHTSRLVGSFDPNDIAVDPVGSCAEHYVSKKQKLTYKIRFQNVGNASAVNVIVLDTLDSNLDINTLRVISKSHEPMALRMLDDSTLEFSFKQIYLPDSTSDEPGSHGYIIFEIQPKDSVPDFTRIENRVAIYFDFNDPVITNTVFNTLIDSVPQSITNLNRSSCGVYELNGKRYGRSGFYIQKLQQIDGCDSLLYLHLDVKYVNTSVERFGAGLEASASNAGYQWLDCSANYTTIAGASNQSFFPEHNGNYAVAISENGCVDTSACYQVINVSISEGHDETFSITPNPVKNTLFISLSSQQKSEIRVFNATGKLMIEASASSTEYPLDVSVLQSGFYFLKIAQGEKRSVKKFVKEF